MFDQKKYIKEYNKKKYKMYQFRVKKEDTDVLKRLSAENNKSRYIVNLIEQDIEKKSVLTLKQIKDSIKPILNKYDITDIYLFGSYARGEATTSSDVDIYCDPGNLKSLLDEVSVCDDLKEALGKEVDVVFSDAEMHEYFRKEMTKDLIKLC